MLHLTRLVGQSIIIGDPSKPLGRLTVTDVRGDRVKLAFDMAGVEINREEIAKAKLANSAAAVATAAPSAQ